MQLRSAYGSWVMKAREHGFTSAPPAERPSTTNQEGLEAFLAIPVGVFADPSFPAPLVSVYESRMHQWVVPPPDAEHIP